MRKILTIGFILIVKLSQAQFTYQLDQEVEAQTEDGTQLPLAFAGGLNTAQYNTMDLDADGHDDLVLFDRMAGKIFTFVRQGSAFAYDPSFENFFPADILNWVLLRDFNCDGKKDLFTGDNLGIKVYKNITSSDGKLSWSHVLFGTGFTGSKSQVLLSKGFTSKVNVQMQFDDLPSITDVDGDGDLDLFVMRYVGDGTIEFHKNFGIERYGTCDSLDFERITQTWGNVRECKCGVFAFNGEDCSVNGRVKHAGGKSLLSIDLNGDGENEILLSEATCAQLSRLNNSGTTLNPVVTSSTAFPLSDPANIIAFPAPYFEDIDDDGIKDLMVTPNVFVRDYLNMDFQNSNWFYRNAGSNTAPDFQLVARNFLQSQMIDVGDNSVPAFFDADSDGDYDLFASNFAKADYTSPIAFFENVGSPQDPLFKLSNGDYLSLSARHDFNRKIQFADINNDNTIDLVFTSTLYDDGITRLSFISNRSTSSLDFSNPAIQSIDLQLTRNENVFVFDVDGDGMSDLLVGRSEGSLELWKQTGNLAFSLADESFAGLDQSVLRQNIACSVSDLDSDGALDLVYGDQTGKLKIIPDFKNQSDVQISNLVWNERAESYEEQNLGGRTWPVAVNLFGSTRAAIVTGNTLGGLTILRHDGGESLPDNLVVDVFPNPVRQTQTINIRTDRPAVVEVYSALGRRVSVPVIVQPFGVFQRSVSELASGLYIIKFSAGKKSVSRKIIIDR